MKQYYIYTLTNPNTGMVFYVGLTCNLEQRLASHIIDASANPKSIYIKSTGIVPVMECVEDAYCTFSEILSLETYWINQFHAWGFEMKNSTGIFKYRINKSVARPTRIKIKEAPKTFDHLPLWISDAVASDILKITIDQLWVAVANKKLKYSLATPRAKPRFRRIDIETALNQKSVA